MSGPRHVMILASAGSGKTYALTNRFVALLARGARPERIVALTFTRKAAGEFFDEILNKLARAARDAAFAGKLAREIDLPQLGTADFIRMLRTVTDAMHRLRLGTLDSFFARIARTFPLELGLAGDFEVLQEHTARLERQRVLRRMFARSGELAAPQKEFIEAFKRATFGTEEKRLGARLDRFLDEHQEIYLSAPAGDRWGQAAQIWPRGSSWLGAMPGREAAVGALRAALRAADLNEKQRARWEAFFAELAGWSAGAELPKPVNYILGNALDAWPELAEIVLERKKFALSPELREALRALLRAIVGAVMARQLETTRGIHAVLRGYEAVYHDAVRRAGKLTFGDVQRLLAPEASGQALTHSPAGEDGRLFIDFRLDAEIEHWLLDEFQDTSFGQWTVLRNLIDEAIQDAEGSRSFFCVGDVKQAIFTWREGDPRLFREIFEHYNSAQPGVIAERHLVESWRSGPALIEMVNAVFGNGVAIGEVLPGAASAAWSREWRDHVSAVPERMGHAAWLHAADEAARWALALQLLLEIQPLERGLTCAVLVPTNSTATALADYLRREGGLPAVAESDLHVCTDNPLGAVMLALVQAAAHPHDTLAREHLDMTPLGTVLAEENLATPEALTQHVLGQIHAEGFERTVDFWLGKLEPRLAPDDKFTRERARQFAAAAGLFDETGSREVAEFVQFMERHTVRDPEGAAVIRVMTIHKSKGLGFDVVLLPDLEGNRIDERRSGLAVQKTANRAVEWVFDLPPKLFWQQDEVLAAHVRAAEAEAGYESLSLLYVAMTRAKRAMYVITKPAGSSTSRNFPKLLAETLGVVSHPLRVGKLAVAGAWERGDPDWHLPLAAGEKIARPSEAIEPLADVAARRVVRRSARRPSAEKRGSLSAAQVFSLENTAGADFGTLVHLLFSEVEWCDAAAEDYAAKWRARGVDEAPREEVLRCLRTSGLAGVWARPPSPRADVWRERAFEIVLEGGVWVTGVFDRAVVERDAAGRAERATVFDFKTDQIATDADIANAVARHAGQLNLYRRVAAVLANLPRERVTCELVFTRVQRRVEVPAER